MHPEPVAWKLFLGEHQYAAVVFLLVVLPTSHSVHDRAKPAGPALHFIAGKTVPGGQPAPPILQRGWLIALPASFGTLSP